MSGLAQAKVKFEQTNSRKILKTADSFNQNAGFRIISLTGITAD